VTAVAASRMGARLTTPFGRGADTLELSLTGAGPSAAAVTPYDFAEHQARFGRAPQPAYVLTAVADVPGGATVTLTYTQPGGPAGGLTADVVIPAGTRAGASFAAAVPVSAQIRVTGLATAPAPAGPLAALPVEQRWRLTALLGTLAKVLWVIGAERDGLRGHVARTVAQRHLPTAIGRSLDFIGFDLGVPRFPPLPYGFDTDTVALYHLDDAPGQPARDVIGQYPGRTGHPGVPRGPVQQGAAGRYGAACGFAARGAFVEVATDATFNVPAAGSATVECFVRPDAGPGDGQVLSRHPNPGGAGAGWVLAVGEFGRGVQRNARLTVADGTTAPVSVFADVSLPADAFSHLAGVLDRAAQELRLYVDGVLRATAALGSLGAVANTAPLLIGPADSAFRGVVDEVRISAVARADFAPTLGEADEHYRRRLRLFRRWVLPTPANLTAMLNELVGPVGGLRDPLVVQEVNAPLVRGTRLVRVRPVTLEPGTSIDAAGRRGVSEVDTVGTAADEPLFDPAFLLRYDRPDIDFSVVPKVQVSLAAALDRLVALAAAEIGPEGELRIAGAYDPAATDLRATGRAVLLDHNTVGVGRLAALAHRAGFGFVRLVPGPTGLLVYAANAPGDYFAVVVNPQGFPADLVVGATTALSLRPAPPSGAVLRWLTVPAGPGRGTLTTVGPPGNPASATSLLATAPGGLVVKAEVALGRHTFTAGRVLRIAPADLPDGQTVAADGTLGAPVSVVSDPDEFFDKRFLARHDDARINYGGVENNRLMQPALAQLLDATLVELARRGATGQLSVTAAFAPGTDEFAAHGRLLKLRHSTLTPGALGALVHVAGFGHVEHAGADVVVRQAPGELVVVHGPAGTDATAVLELDEGASIAVSVQPTGLSQVRLGWATGQRGPGRAILGNPTLPASTLHGDTAGLTWVQASYLLGDAPAPHTFRVGLRPELDRPDTVISKDQYDLILNILNALHPVGIEVSTQVVRDHTVEVRGDLAPVNPDFTFPKFRVRSVLAPLRRDNTRG